MSENILEINNLSMSYDIDSDDIFGKKTKIK